MLSVVGSDNVNNPSFIVTKLPQTFQRREMIHYSIEKTPCYSETPRNLDIYSHPQRFNRLLLVTPLPKKAP
jgi:hypothetical protein